MSQQDYSDWTAEQRRNYIRTQIPLKDWFNKSGAAILKELRARGLGINTGDFYDIQRGKKAPTTIQSNFEQLDGNETIPVAWAESHPDWALSQDYMYQFLVVGRDPKTGDKTTSFFALSTSDPLEKDAALDKITGMISADEETYGIVPEEATLYEMYTRLEY